MQRPLKVGVISDVHYAGAAEQARGDDYELRAVANRLHRALLRWYRHTVWLRTPLRHGHLLDAALEQLHNADFLVANGDFSCDSGFVGVSDEAACQSTDECLTRIRQRFPGRAKAVFGDHELGKFTLVGKQGGMRLASFHRATQLGIEPFWEKTLGRHTLFGVCSSLLALPALRGELLEAERTEWERLRAQHLETINEALNRTAAEQRLVIFCHDPTAIPFLWRETHFQTRTGQVAATIIGHLHSPLIFWKSQRLAGIPAVGFLGHSVRKMTHALHEARVWRHFRVRLCPSLAGIELLKDGGYLTLTLDSAGGEPLKIERHRLRR